MGERLCVEELEHLFTSLDVQGRSPLLESEGSAAFVAQFRADAVGKELWFRWRTLAN
jgi:hypothetical protein